MGHKTHHVKKEEITVDGRIHEITSYHDEHGNILHKIISPLMIEFHPKDVLQVIVGATIIAIPVSFTQEVWELGLELPFINLLFLMLLSFFFIGTFTYYTYYRGKAKKHLKHFIRRTFSTYLLTFILAATILTIIHKGAFMTDTLILIKRAIIVSFPASMSAAIADKLQ